MDGTIDELAASSLGGPEEFRQRMEDCRPLLIRGLVAEWPAVKAADESPEAFLSYVAQFDANAQLEAFIGQAGIEGKYYYGADLEGFNFRRENMTFMEALRRIVATAGRDDLETLYAGSVSVDAYLPGFSSQNAMTLVPPAARGRIWLGHRANISSHYDTLDNLACVIAGRRRFTLYPPQAIGNLYVGPIDNTMAGQPVSLAASSPEGPQSDELFPLFRKVRHQALRVDLEPGDALYLPKLWWHQVESTGAFNGLVNYWWDAFSAGPDAPYTSLLLAMIAISERPEGERDAWRAYFDHYVFRRNGHPLAHLPEEKHGVLGPLRPKNYGKIRALVMHLLRGGA